MARRAVHPHVCALPHCAPLLRRLRRFSCDMCPPLGARTAATGCVPAHVVRPEQKSLASGGTSLAIRHGSPASSSDRAPRSLPRPSVPRNRPPSFPLPGTRGLRRFRACGCSLREAPLRLRLPCGRLRRTLPRHAPSVWALTAAAGAFPVFAGCRSGGAVSRFRHPPCHEFRRNSPLRLQVIVVFILL